MKTRVELQRIVNNLEACISQWIVDGADETDLAMAFAYVSHNAFENVSPMDYDWLRVEMFEMQARYGIDGQ